MVNDSVAHGNYICYRITSGINCSLWFPFKTEALHDDRSMERIILLSSNFVLKKKQKE